MVVCTGRWSASVSGAFLFTDVVLLIPSPGDSEGALVEEGLGSLIVAKTVVRSTTAGALRGLVGQGLMRV